MKIIFNIEPVEQARPRATKTWKGIRLYDPKKGIDLQETVGDDVQIPVQG